MTELVDKAGRKLTKHCINTQRTEKLDGMAIEIQFSPGARKSLAKLLAAVSGSKCFQGVEGHETQKALEEFVAGKPRDLPSALVTLACIGEGTGKYFAETGNKRAAEALEEFYGWLMEPWEHGFTLVMVPKQRGR